jgi:hypothetical protein
MSVGVLAKAENVSANHETFSDQRRVVMGVRSYSARYREM